MDSNKKRTVLLGAILLFFLGLSYIENTSFFVYIRDSFIINPPLAIVLMFIHNVLAISLIILAMAFYVETVLTFMPKRKIEYVVLENPKVFAAVFTVVILLISILRASTLVRGQVEVNMLALVMLLSMPNGLVEGYGIFHAIRKTLKKNLSMRDLILIYSFFFIAAVIEVGLTLTLIWIWTK